MKKYILVILLVSSVSCSLTTKKITRKIASSKMLTDSGHHTFYKGLNLKTATYRLNPLGMSLDSCSSAIIEKSNELKRKGFKILDVDSSSCNDKSVAMLDSHTITIIFD
jgi:hypothetical protein